jgi:hypothetical protein
MIVPTLASAKFNARDWTEDQPKMLLAATILLRETSATLAQSVNDPTFFGGGSIGSNRNQDSALQKEMHLGVMQKRGAGSAAAALEMHARQGIGAQKGQSWPKDRERNAHIRRCFAFQDKGVPLPRSTGDSRNKGIPWEE